MLCDALKDFLESQGRAGAAVAAFSENEDFEGPGRSFAKASEGLAGSTEEELERTLKRTLAGPLVSLQNLLTDVDSLIGKRGRKLLDYNAARTKTRRALEKDGTPAAQIDERLEDILKSPSSSPSSPFPGSPSLNGARSPSLASPATSRLSKSQSALLEAYDAYAGWNSLLLSEIPQIYELRTSYLEPEVEALISTMQTLADEFATAARTLDPFEQAGNGVQDMERMLEGCVEEMNGLAICGGNF